MRKELNFPAVIEAMSRSEHLRELPLEQWQRLLQAKLYSRKKMGQKYGWIPRKFHDGIAAECIFRAVLEWHIVPLLQHNRYTVATLLTNRTMLIDEGGKFFRDRYKPIFHYRECFVKDTDEGNRDAAGYDEVLLCSHPDRPEAKLYLFDVTVAKRFRGKGNKGTLTTSFLQPNAIPLTKLFHVCLRTAQSQAREQGRAITLPDSLAYMADDSAAQLLSQCLTSHRGVPEVAVHEFVETLSKRLNRPM